MRIVVVPDKHGFLRRYKIRDDMLDIEAEAGIPVNPPDVSTLDCEEIMRELNNLLVERNLITLNDVAASQQTLNNTILAVLQPRIVNLYKQTVQPIIIGKNGKHPDK
jgi:hypothetical protein